MHFYQYLKDKRFFIFFYVCTMFIVSLFMIIQQSLRIPDILYINVLCGSIAITYIVTGFYYHKEFYQHLTSVTKCNHQDLLAILPKAQTYEQQLFIKLFHKVYKKHLEQLNKLHHDREDYQDFITTWIHEVKVPIAASRLLIESNQDQSIELLIDKLEDELDKIDHYVEQALYYSRIDTFSKDYFIHESTLREVVKESVKKYAKSFINKEIHFHMEDLHQSVKTDSKWLIFIIDQIFSNALKYTEKGDQILAYSEEDPYEKRLLIKDTGMGIKQEDLHRVFEKGFTGSIGRKHSKSTGIGLYLAKKMALKLNHNLTIRSKEEVFTEVIIHFPKIRNYDHF